MESVNVVTIGYYNYTVDEDFLPLLLTAAAQGKIKSVDKKYIDGVPKVVVGKRVDINAEHLEVISSREAELDELRARLKKLEG